LQVVSEGGKREEVLWEGASVGTDKPKGGVVERKEGSRRVAGERRCGRIKIEGAEA
jgi:hypothetical protein